MKKILLSVLALLAFTFGGTAQTLPSYVPANGLVGWWPFNGNANDESGNNNNGMVNGATLTADRFGNAAKAYSFNGILGTGGSYIQTTFPGVLGNSSRSISVWVKRSAPLGNHTNIITWGNSSVSGAGIGIMMSTLGSPFPYVAIGTAGGYVGNQFASITDGNWHHYVFVYDNSISSTLTGIKIYIDGVQAIINVTYLSSSVNTQALLNLVFGQNDPNGDTRTFAGDIDDAAIFNRVLTVSEIAGLYNSPQSSLVYTINQQRNGTCPGNTVLLSAVTSISLNTKNITSITNNSAVSGGTIINDGGQIITQRGVCWSTSPNPTTALSTKTINGSGSGSFNSSLTSLAAATTYYVRAYATSASGTWYGDEKTFTTATTSSTVTDIDGNIYNTVTIGTQTWMKENLRVSKYRNGAAITNQTGVLSSTSGAWCNYQNNPTYNSVYGKMYNWYAVVDTRGLCPAGWHSPTDNEWSTLEAALGMSATDLLIQGVISRGAAQNIGGKLKAVSVLWTSTNVGATNESGFTILPGGSRNDGGTSEGLGAGTQMWTATQPISRLYASNSASSFRLGIQMLADGKYVRCIKD